MAWLKNLISSIGNLRPHFFVGHATGPSVLKRTTIEKDGSTTTTEISSTGTISGLKIGIGGPTNPLDGSIDLTSVEAQKQNTTAKQASDAYRKNQNNKH